MKLDPCADAGRDRRAASPRRQKSPRKYGTASLVGERLGAVDHDRPRDRSVDLDRQIEKHDGVAVRSRGYEATSVRL